MTKSLILVMLQCCLVLQHSLADGRSSTLVLISRGHVPFIPLVPSGLRLTPLQIFTQRLGQSLFPVLVALRHGLALTSTGPPGHSAASPARRVSCRSSVVERILGKAEVVSSILTGSTTRPGRAPARPQQSLAWFASGGRTVLQRPGGTCSTETRIVSAMIFPECHLPIGSTIISPVLNVRLSPVAARTS